VIRGFGDFALRLPVVHLFIPPPTTASFKSSRVAWAGPCATFLKGDKQCLRGSTSLGDVDPLKTYEFPDQFSPPHPPRRSLYGGQRRCAIQSDVARDLARVRPFTM